MFATLLQDIRYGARKLRSAPGFTLLAVLTLALGLGPTGVLLGVVDALLSRPPADVSDPGRVMRVKLQLPSPPGEPPDVSSVVSYVDYKSLRDRTRGFSSVAAFAR